MGRAAARCWATLSKLQGLPLPWPPFLCISLASQPQAAPAIKRLSMPRSVRAPSQRQPLSVPFSFHLPPPQCMPVSSSLPAHPPTECCSDKFAAATG